MSLAKRLAPTCVSPLPACSHGSLSGPPRLRALTVRTAPGAASHDAVLPPSCGWHAPCFCHVSNAWAVLPRQTCPFPGESSGRVGSSAQVSLGVCLADLYLTAGSRRANDSEPHAERGFRTNLDGARSLIQSELKICYLYSGV